MLCLSGFELYSRWVPLEEKVKLVRVRGRFELTDFELTWFRK